jgi:pimeloyl-ACP methyl ester carboxylesterase
MPVAATPPPRPGIWAERAAAGLFFAAAPRLQHRPQPEPPEGLRPWEQLTVERGGGLDPVAATWYPAMAAPSATVRGAVLLLHPWVDGGRTYFHRRGRIEALREAGYHALAVDFGGFGGTRRRLGFLDLDVETALNTLRRLAGDLPLHVWGVSAGGYWTHMVLSRRDGVLGAMFEDVSPHLLEWSWRMAPLGRPAYLFFRTALRRAYRYLDIRLHAPALGVRAASYAGGGRDRGMGPEDVRILAAAAGGRYLVVPAADHLGAIQMANQDVIALALDTFRRAEGAAQRR